MSASTRPAPHEVGRDFRDQIASIKVRQALLRVGSSTPFSTWSSMMRSQPRPTTDTVGRHKP